MRRVVNSHSSRLAEARHSDFAHCRSATARYGHIGCPGLLGKDSAQGINLHHFGIARLPHGTNQVGILKISSCIVESKCELDCVERCGFHRTWVNHKARNLESLAATGKHEQSYNEYDSNTVLHKMIMKYNAANISIKSNPGNTPTKKEAHTAQE